CRRRPSTICCCQVYQSQRRLPVRRVRARRRPGGALGPEGEPPPGLRRRHPPLPRLSSGPDGAAGRSQGMAQADPGLPGDAGSRACLHQRCSLARYLPHAARQLDLSNAAPLRMSGRPPASSLLMFDLCTSSRTESRSIPYVRGVPYATYTLSASAPAIPSRSPFLAALPTSPTSSSSSAIRRLASAGSMSVEGSCRIGSRNAAWNWATASTTLIV